MLVILLVIALFFGFIIGLVLIPFVVYGLRAPGALGGALGNIMMTVTALASGGTMIEHTPDGNYRFIEYDEGIGPEEHKDKLWLAPFGITYTPTDASFGDAAIKGELLPGEPSPADADVYIWSEENEHGREIYYWYDRPEAEGRAYITGGGGGGGQPQQKTVRVKIPVKTREYAWLSTDEVLSAEREEAKADFGGDSSSLSPKVMGVGMLVSGLIGLILAVVLGV